MKGKKLHCSPNVLLELGDLAFLCNSHTKIIAKISNMTVRRHCYSNGFYWKWARERARKIAYETKLNVLEASQSWKTSIFILLVCFGSKPSTCAWCICALAVYTVHTLFYINQNRNSCVFPSKSKCDHFLCSLFIRSCKIECYKMVDKPTFQHVLPVCT